MFNQKRDLHRSVWRFFHGRAVGGSAFALAIAAPPGSFIAPNETFGGQGWLATAQVGCDYQFSNDWVIGDFVDGDWTDLKGDHGLLGIFSGQQTMRWSWAIGGRVGYLVTPSLLTYVSAGYTEADFSGVSFAHNNATSAIALTSPPVAFAMAVTRPGPLLHSEV